MIRVYGIYDKVAESYQNMFTAVNDNAAMRIVKDITNDLGSMINMSPEDYTLLRFGSFDSNDIDNPLLAESISIKICSCSDLIRKDVNVSE